MGYTDADDTLPLIVTKNTVWSDVYSEDDASASVANSIGTTLYYERADGQSKGLERSIDSAMFLQAYEVYNSVKKDFESKKSTYETDKKAYETAVEDRKKDPKKELPKRPSNPAAPGAYSGPSLQLQS